MRLLFLFGIIAAPVMAEEIALSDIDIKTAMHQRSVQKSCVFTTECNEDKGCSDTFYSVEVAGMAGGPSLEHMKVEGEMYTMNGDFPITGQRASGGYSMVGGDLAARHLLTLTADGMARYTIHYGQGPASYTFLGKC